MGLFSGLALIGIALLGDAPANARVRRQNEIQKRYSHPECRPVIDKVIHTWKDDLGNEVIEYMNEHSYHDETGLYHWCPPDEAMYQLAKAQCERQGIPWGETEAFFSFHPNTPSVREWAISVGLIRGY